MRRSRERAIERERRRGAHLGRKAALAAGAATAASVVFAPAADAATFTVDTLADTPPDGCAADAEDECTLREAIAAANADPDADVVTFQSGLSGTITLAAGDLDVNSDVQVQGPGAGAMTLDGAGSDQVFNVYGTGNQVGIAGLTMTNGSAGPGDGGAIFSTDADLTLTESVISDSSAGDDGGGIGSFSGSLALVGSVITGNAAEGSGGGLVVRQSDLRVERSTISDNSANHDGGGLYFLGSGSGAESFALSSSTVSDNEAARRGGGGITILRLAAPGAIESSTVSGNSAPGTTPFEGFPRRGLGRGGGVYFYSELDPPMTIRNSTIVGNDAAYTGGGVYRYAYENDAGGEDNLAISSTIVANNTAPDGDLGDQQSAGGDPGPVAGSFILGFSLIENPGTAVRSEDPAGSNIFGQDPQLGPLEDNGGPTATHLPAATSPAIDAGISNGLLTDQRGEPRTGDQPEVPNRSGSDGTDIGAVERSAPPPAPPTAPEPARAECQGTSVLSKTGSESGETLIGTEGSDAIFGLGGDDVIEGVGGADCLNGGEGQDTLRGAAGKDLERGGADSDNVRGQGGKDELRGSAGDDRMNGGEGSDDLRGGPGDDRMRGAGGEDTFRGKGGGDRINAVDAKADDVRCGAGDDKATVDPIDNVSANCETVREVERKD